MDPITTVIVGILVGLLAGFLSAIAGGGGGLISIPLFMLLGVPVHTSIASTRFGGIGFSAIIIYRYWKAKKIIWKFVLPISIVALVGGLYGASLLVKINEELLAVIVSVILLALLPLLLLEKDLGIVSKTTTKRSRYIGYILLLAVTVFAGFFGGGSGLIGTYVIMYFFGTKIIDANGTKAIPWGLVSVATFIIFAMNGIVDYVLGFALLIGDSIGGYFGTNTAIRKGDRWVKSVFVLLFLALAIKLLIF